MTRLSSLRHGAASLALAAFLAAGAFAAPALADKAAGDACAAQLDADGKTIYAASLPSVAAGGDVRSVVTDTTKSLVMGGKVGRANARPAAEAAGKCLVVARS